MPEIILDRFRISRRNQFYPFRKVRKNTSLLHRDEWFKIVNDFNKMVMDEIIYNNLQFKMPYNLGLISIMKQKIWKGYINDNGDLVSPYPNKNGKRFIPKVRTDYFYRFVWLRGRLKNSSYYQFVPTKPSKAKLKKILNDPNNTMDYYEIKGFKR